MRFNAPPISELRLRRLHRWILLWLTWFAVFLREPRAFAPLSAHAQGLAHQWLDQIERALIGIVLWRAAPYVRAIPLKHPARRRIDTHLRRAIVGSAMRRALRSKDLSRRIAALSQDIDLLVACVLKRLPRGLTRRRSHPTRPELRGAAPDTIAAIRAPSADTS
jgi:hypothetical protein